MEVLKKFLLNAATSSLSERERLFNDLFNLLDSQSAGAAPTGDALPAAETTG
jgi:hypothetical protein